MYSVQFIERSLKHTLFSVQCTLYSVQCAMNTIRCTLYTVQCTVYSLHCTVYSVQCTMHTHIHCYRDIIIINNIHKFTIIIEDNDEDE